MNYSDLLFSLLLIGILPCGCLSQESARTPISQEDFYQEALRDVSEVARFGDVAEALRKKSIVLVDVRSKEEFEHSHIKGAVSIPATDLTEETLSKLIPDKNMPIVIYCENNFNAFSRMVPLTTLAFPVFRRLGYQKVQILECVRPPNDIPLELEPLAKE